MYNNTQVNSRKSITLPNRTNYFNPDKDRSHITFSSPSAYQTKEQKIEGYENRLYWEYRFCEENDGQTFFYTLTYNNKSLPKYLGQPCFDYNDLRYILNGAFKKILLRKFGTTFKYFVGAELGEGAGDRGYENNPHYHILFFLRSANSPEYPYKKIDPLEFRHYIREYWQGFDEITDGFYPYESAKYGIVREGDDLGKVYSFAASRYVSKYVTKDVNLKKFEDKVVNHLTHTIDFSGIKRDFYNDRIHSWYVIPQDEVTDDVVDKIIDEYELTGEFSNYKKHRIERHIKDGLNEYRNRYCNKCRISKGVGDYALSHIKDLMDPSIEVATEKGFKVRPLGLYYYRKLYYDVVKDASGNPIRVLNQLGIDYKVNRLPSDINKLVNKTSANVEVLDEKLYNSMITSDVNTTVRMSYDRYKELMNNIQNKQELYERYAKFKLVYEDRFYALQANGDNYSHPDINYLSDYRNFLSPSYYNTDYDPDRLDTFFANSGEGYLAYWSHPYFLQYVSLFSVFDLCSDFLFCQTDKQSERKADEIKQINKFHKYYKGLF